MAVLIVNEAIVNEASNDMLKTLFSNLSKIGRICLSIPVTTASVERSNEVNYVRPAEEIVYMIKAFQI